MRELRIHGRRGQGAGNASKLLPAALVARGDTLVPEPGAAPDPGPPRPPHPRPARCATPADLESPAGDAYCAQRRDGALVIEARLGGQRHRLAVMGGEAVYRGPRVRAYWKVEGWVLTSAEPAAELAEGERIDLSPCAVLVALAEELAER